MIIPCYHSSHPCHPHFIRRHTNIGRSSHMPILSNHFILHPESTTYFPPFGCTNVHGQSLCSNQDFSLHLRSLSIHPSNFGGQTIMFCCWVKVVISTLLPPISPYQRNRGSSSGQPEPATNQDCRYVKLCPSTVPHSRGFTIWNDVMHPIMNIQKVCAVTFKL